MILRIQFPKGTQVRRQPGRNRQVALAASSLVSPMSLMAYVLGFWRLASDVGVAGDSGFTGVFSHWQPWIALAVALHLTARGLAKYGNGEALEMSILRTILRQQVVREPGTVRRGPSGPY